MASRIDFAALKTLQDDLDARKKRILDHFTPFCEGIIDAMEQLVAEGLANNIRGLRALQRKSGGLGIIEATCAIGESAIVLIGSDELYFQEGTSRLHPPMLAAKFFVYYDGEPTFPPAIVVTVPEALGTDPLRCRVEWMTAKGSRHLYSGYAMAKTDGLAVAQAIFTHFQEIEFHWKPLPPLGGIRERRGYEGSSLIGVKMMP